LGPSEVHLPEVPELGNRGHGPRNFRPELTRVKLAPVTAGPTVEWKWRIITPDSRQLLRDQMVNLMHVCVNLIKERVRHCQGRDCGVQPAPCTPKIGSQAMKKSSQQRPIKRHSRLTHYNTTPSLVAHQFPKNQQGALGRFDGFQFVSRFPNRTYQNMLRAMSWASQPKSKSRHSVLKNDFKISVL